MWCTVLYFHGLYWLYSSLTVVQFFRRLGLYCVSDVLVLMRCSCLQYSNTRFFSYVRAVLNVPNVVVEQQEIPLTTSGLMGSRCAQLVEKTGTKAIIVRCVRNVTLMKILNQRWCNVWTANIGCTPRVRYERDLQTLLKDCHSNSNINVICNCVLM